MGLLVRKINTLLAVIFKVTKSILWQACRPALIGKPLFYLFVVWF